MKTLRDLPHLVLAILLVASAADAQVIEDYRFKGTTVDTSGTAIPGVEILFYDVETGYRVNFKSKKDGTFDKHGIKHGTYDVRFEKEGYITVSQRFSWLDVAAKTIVKEATITLDSVEAKATREAAAAEASLGKKKAELYQDAYAALAKNDCAVARPKAEKLLELGAESYEYATRFVIARCMGLANDFDGAIPELQKVIELKADLYEAHFDLANAYSAKKQFDEALASYRNAADLKPGIAVVHYEMGAILFNQGQLPAARPHLERAVALDPNHAAAHMALGYVILSAEEKDYQKAKRLLSRFLELDAQNPNAATVKAIVDGIE